jgi:Golgi SNAP receptor complex protein 1
MATYDSLHRQCRTLESLFDSKLTSYARLAATISRAGTNDDLEAGPSWREAEGEVEDLLEKVRFMPSTPLSLDELRDQPGRFAMG